MKGSYWNVTCRGVDHIVKAGGNSEIALCGKRPPKEWRCWPYRAPLIEAHLSTPTLCKRCLAKLEELEKGKEE